VHDETSVREVFEFVEWDCELVVEPAAQVPGPDNAALDDLIEKMQATVEAGLAAREVPPTAIEVPTAEPTAAIASNAAQALSNSPGGKQETGKPSQATIRGDLDRVDRLINLVG
jgi:two-component system, chemotaxis family, sensor kinase CheA